jgi:hypothetical protein
MEPSGTTSTGGKDGFVSRPAGRLQQELREGSRASSRRQSLTAPKAAQWQNSLDGWSMVKCVGTAHGAVRDGFDGG